MEQVACRGIRGAITLPDQDPATVRTAVGELLEEIVAANGCDPSEVAAAVFTVTDDLGGTSPAAEARAEGWAEVPLLVVREHGGGTPLPRCLRVLILWNTARAQEEIRHVYLRDAARLRPDLQRAERRTR